jgi:hypothetical protein
MKGSAVRIRASASLTAPSAAWDRARGRRDYAGARGALGTALGLCELSGQAGMEHVCLSCMAYVLRDFGLLQTRDAGPRPGAWLTLGGIGDDRYRRHPPIDDVHIPGRTAPRSPPAIA